MAYTDDSAGASGPGDGLTDDLIDVDIERMATGGEAIARPVDAPVIFVRGALPGERVRVQVSERRKRMWRANTVEVLRAAAERRVPPCSHAQSACGGCDWMHASPEAQTEFKRLIVVEQLNRLGKVDTPTVDVRSHPRGRRTTVRCLITDGRAGYRSRGSNTGFAVTSCSAAHPQLEQLLIDGRFGDASEAVLRVGATTGERVALIEGLTTRAVLPDDVAISMSDQAPIHYHEEVAGRRWRISGRSFFQTSHEGAEALVGAVGEQLGDDDGAVVDLYAGVGLLGGSVAGDRLRTVVESNASSYEDARHNLGSDVRVVQERVERWTPDTCAAVIADPSRRGLQDGGVKSVAATGAKRLVLVSCDPAALGRDAALLAQQGFTFVRSELIDMFPDTSRCEVVSTFAR